ncbi:MAG: fatty acid desaturase [Phycisphaeraceae bacterium]|nr:fatty acid desaturase [Phycisphaeraceae bacterium]
MATTRDQALRDVVWCDLLPMTRLEIAHEVMICLPWLAVSAALYGLGLVPLGMVGSFFVFLTGLRLSHGCQHYQLPVARHWQDKILFALSAVMLTSMHAVQATHLNHHRHCLDDDDFEGKIARRPFWLALLTGPLFPIRLHVEALRLARRSKRRWVVAELLVVVGIVAATPWLPTALQWHVLAMLVGECFVGFSAVWTVHHGCGDDVPYRTLRSGWLNRLSYNMFLHTEHHLFPAVPTCHLHQLAKRIDAASSAYRRVLVFPTAKTR